MIVEGTPSKDGTSTAATSISQSSGLGSGSPFGGAGLPVPLFFFFFFFFFFNRPLRPDPAAVPTTQPGVSRRRSVGQGSLVLSTLCVFNTIILLLLGAGSLVFVDGRTSLHLAAALWIAAILLFTLSHGLRRGADWPGVSG